MSEDLRQRYAAALDMTEPFAEHLLDAMMAVRDEEMERLQAALDAADLALHEAISHSDDACPAAAAVERVRAVIAANWWLHALVRIETIRAALDGES